jgi:NAD(P)-dependent dehydrogenase (short-subunit alcohol dehydrogenase family)
MDERILEGKVVLIIGAGRPPGPALAASLALQGAVIALNDLTPILLDPVVDSIQAQGGRARAYVADSARGMPARAMLDEVLEDWGQVDVLINNPRVQPQAELASMDEWDWQRTIEMNLNGPFLMTQLVTRVMREQGGGTVINIVDVNAGALETPGRAAYAASQAGLLSLSRAASRELISYNIRVHTLCPAEVVLRSDAAMDSAVSAVKEIADLLVYLCSPAADHLPGQIFQAKRQE